MTTETIKVKALRQHLNDIGEHQIGDEYVTDRRHAEILIARGVVEPAVEKGRSAPENKRVAKAPSTKA